MRFRVRALYALAMLLAASACSGTASLFRQYQYEEEMYLALDGTATVYVNSSLAALNALRGTAFDTSPADRVDVAAIRAVLHEPADARGPRDPIAPQRPAIRPRAPRRRRRHQAGRGRAVRLVAIPAHA